jgi:hypothetical protein
MLVISNFCGTITCTFLLLFLVESALTSILSTASTDYCVNEMTPLLNDSKYTYKVESYHCLKYTTPLSKVNQSQFQYSPQPPTIFECSLTHQITPFPAIATSSASENVKQMIHLVRKVAKNGLMRICNCAWNCSLSVFVSASSTG